ncbi:hypothetical protein DE4576_04090 [Mycobacterium marinum]|nr:hypothetical protein DE4576_04090 [Mycobacterium marinum]
MAGIARRDRGIIDIDHRHRITRQPLRQPRGTDHRYRRGILDHEPDTPIRMIDIDRQIRCTAFEYRQDRDDRLNRALQQQPDHITRTHTLINQQMRQPISRPIKLAIGQRPIPTHQRRHLGTAGHLRGEQPRNRHRLHQRLRQHRPITHHIQPRMLGRRHLGTAGHLRGEQPRNRHRLHQRLRQHRPITHHIQPRMLGYGRIAVGLTVKQHADVAQRTVPHRQQSLQYCHQAITQGRFGDVAECVGICCY